MKKLSTMNCQVSHSEHKLDSHYSTSRIAEQLKVESVVIIEKTLTEKSLAVVAEVFTGGEVVGI